jgi:hypothetical protein
VAYGAGKNFYYAGVEGAEAYKTDPIATRGALWCAPEPDKIPEPVAKKRPGRPDPARLSQKPVAVLEYFITALVRARAYAGCVSSCPHRSASV